MSESVSYSPTPPEPMSEVQRLGCIFTEPSATFKEIAVGRRSWWLPFVVMCLFSYLLFAAITVKVGWHQVAVNTLHADTATMERLEQAPPESRAQTIEQTTRTMEYSLMGGFAASPVVILIQLLLVAGVLMATINFIFAGKATFSDSLAVTAFSFLPSVIKSALGAAVAWFMVPESFNLQNFAPTSVGAFLSQTDTPAWLYKLASALDATTLWCMLLLGIGFATIGKVKRSGGYLAAFGWWGLLTLIGVVWAAARG